MSEDAAASSSQPPPPGQAFSSSRMPLLRQRSTTTGTDRRSLDLPMLGLTDTNKSSGSGSNVGSSKSAMQSDSRNTPRRNKLQSGGDIDRQWIEMQNTLGEVELAGATGGASVFSSGHALALEELRKAQIALAQAWARSETDDVDAEGDITADRQDTQAARENGGADVLANDRREQLNSKAKGRAGGASGTARTKLEEETENDIELARRRRAANDRYFEKVNKGVVDVVEKLEAVASKMRGVEMESKEIWGSEDTVDDESMV